MRDLTKLGATLVLVGLLLGACAAPPLSPAASKVQVHHQYTAVLDGCKKLGPVSYSTMNRFWRRSYPRLEGGLREEVAKLGGDSVVLLQRSDAGSEAAQHGIAYRCY